MQGEPIEAAFGMENLRGPAAGSGGSLDFAEHGVDVNGLAMVTVMIFAKFLHAENFAQRCRGARGFYGFRAETR